jgi:serine phosphatase RsbU (regulator of sigma subunit)
LAAGFDRSRKQQKHGPFLNCETERQHQLAGGPHLNFVDLLISVPHGPGNATTLLTEGSTVLGLFPQAQYEERSFPLQSGDCILLTTDGVTEAANEVGEEFGAERVAASALAARGLSANGIRTRIFDDVSRFCNGNFHDDASLIVMTVLSESFA